MGGFLYWSAASGPALSEEAIRELALTDMSAALRAAERRRAAAPHDASAALLLGGFYEMSGTDKKAEKVYADATRANPGEPMLFFYLGRVRYRLNKIDPAIESLIQFQKMAARQAAYEKEREAASLLLGEIYLDFTKEYRKAAIQLKNALDIDPANADARYALATAYAYSNQTASAFKEFETVIRENPGTELAQYAENAMQYVRERRNPTKSRYLKP